MGGASESSSGEEDGDAEWRKAIDSVASTTASYVASAATTASYVPSDHGDGQNPKLKHYQIKAQKLLDEILDKTLEIVKDHPVHAPDTNTLSNGGENTESISSEGVIRLFKHSKPGIVLEPVVEPQQPQKKPKILPREEIDEKSKKFKRRLQSVAVDGEDILAAARNVSQKSLERLQAKEAAAKEAAKREGERVAELKRIRGERWLPSIARDMKLNSEP